ncbi:uncharacterized protein LOC119078944 [Bradysia coprophila]|uniref:uncharacterized protein LOC119078944 n=1 Tax=Bradysia coprophila TaxID=38358 RepID=UPI00187DA5F7|nr:uncharacterized protein LOC119078944 [Bradysia coprophila]
MCFKFLVYFVAFVLACSNALTVPGIFETSPEAQYPTIFLEPRPASRHTNVQQCSETTVPGTLENSPEAKEPEISLEPLPASLGANVQQSNEPSETGNEESEAAISTAEVIFTSCARMNDGAAGEKVAQGLCISSCKFQNCGTGKCEYRGRPVCVCSRCASGGGEWPSIPGKTGQTSDIVE